MAFSKLKAHLRRTGTKKIVPYGKP